MFLIYSQREEKGSLLRNIIWADFETSNCLISHDPICWLIMPFRHVEQDLFTYFFKTANAFSLMLIMGKT